ncbi:MAG: MBL fold metallo-hydrolase [Flavobacterium sp.]|nr:MAG: MBL fold metallo-hydrolase [Flavobacterium sp.]
MLLPFIILLIIVSVYLFLKQPSFGAISGGKRLERIRQSPNYRDGKFQNLSETPMMTKDASMPKIMWNFLFNREKTDPEKPIPTVKSNLKAPTNGKTIITWFGHSSYFLLMDGVNILVDPVFSQRTSPVQWFGTKAFLGTSIYGADDFPEIDVLLLTHDHYDHLDYNTIKNFKTKIKRFITTLGVGAHLEKWGIEGDKITELDWNDEIIIQNNIKINCLTARHFSGRGMTKRNQSLWASFAIKSSSANIYIGGDSGYDAHFAAIGNKFGPFDLAILECGQYNKFWPYIHMMPEQTAQAAKDLKADVLLPVHWGKFKLSSHFWSEPVNRVKTKANEIGQKITTPMIDEQIILGEKYPDKKWWENI